MIAWGVIRWSGEKNRELQQRRGISFDRIAALYETEVTDKRHIFELDKEEKQIENEIDQYVPADEETKATVGRIARESRKRKNVNIRISERDLSQIRERASREGVPYQTLIASVLHKYVTDQLYDEREIRKTLELIESSGTE